MKAAVDRVADPLRHRHRAVLGGQEQADRPAHERHAAGGDPGADPGHRVERAVGHRIDQQRALDDTLHASLAHPVAEHGHFGEPRLHQPAAGEAGGVGLGRCLHEDVEPVSLADARRQGGLHPDERRLRRGEERVGIDDAALLHVGEEHRPLRPGRRVAARVGQSGDQRGPLDPLRAESRGDRVVADEFGVGLEAGEGLDLGALTADGRARTTRRGHEERQADEERETVQDGLPEDHGERSECGRPGKRRRGQTAAEGRSPAATGQGSFATV